METVDLTKGKSFSIADDKGPKQLLMRSKKGVFIIDSYTGQQQKADCIFGNASFLLQTTKSNLIIASSETKMLVYSLSENKVCFEEQFKYIYSITLSPNEKYLQILDKIDSNEGTTILYSIPSFQKIIEFRQNALSNYYVKTSYPLVKFTSDDKLFFRYKSKVIEIYDRSCKNIRTIKCGLQEFFKISNISSQKNYLIACVFLDKKCSKGVLHLYNESKDEPVYEKNINKAEEIKIKFSPMSNRFLLQLQTYFDPTGKSYYGQYGLYLYNDQFNKISKVKTLAGPVHDFSWDKQGQNFIVMSGFMPGEPVLFSKNNQLIYEFGKQHKNNIIWGNLGRFVCFGGFGNLNGQMDMWDLETKTKIGMCKSNAASYCQWSPDDRKIITSIVTPRLRVDNCYKIFSYTGVLLHKANFDHTQLYEAVWLQNNTKKQIEARGISPGRKAEIEDKKDQPKFKSFASSLNFDAFGQESKTEKSGVVPGQHVEDPPKKKKRIRHRKDKEPDLEA